MHTFPMILGVKVVYMYIYISFIGMDQNKTMSLVYFQRLKLFSQYSDCKNTIQVLWLIQELIKERKFIGFMMFASGLRIVILQFMPC